MKRFSIIEHRDGQEPKKVGSVLKYGILDFVSSIPMIDSLQPYYVLVPLDGGESLRITKSHHLIWGLDEAPFPCTLEYEILK